MGIIFSVLSLILYLLAPNAYSYEYCILLMFLFIANCGYLLWVDRKVEIIGFNFLFSVTLFLVSYLYPIFVYPIMPDYSLFTYAINHNVITRSTALVNLCYAFYSLAYLKNIGHCRKKTIKNNINRYHPSIRINISMDYLYYCMLIVIVFSLLFGGISFFAGLYNSDFEDNNNSFGLFWVFISTFVLFCSIIEILKESIRLRITIFITVLFIAFLGSRTIALCVLSIYMVNYSYKYKLSINKILLYASPLFILFAGIGFFRTQFDEDFGEGIGLLAVFRDFIINNRNLYSLYDYVDRAGVNYGLSFMGHLLSAIPFGQSLFVNTFGVDSYKLRSDTFVTYKDDAVGLGLGTHIIGDVYVAFGFLGCLILFYSLGWFIAYYRKKMLRNRIIGFLVYYVMVSGAVFMDRAGYFYNFKTIIWVLILYHIFNNYNKRYRRFIHRN